MKTNHTLDKRQGEGSAPTDESQAVALGKPTAPSLLQLSVRYKPKYEIVRVLYG